MSNDIDYCGLFNQILCCYHMQLNSYPLTASKAPENASNEWAGKAILTPTAGGSPIIINLVHHQDIESQVCKAVAQELPDSELAHRYARLTFAYPVQMIEGFAGFSRDQVQLVLPGLGESTFAKLFQGSLHKLFVAGVYNLVIRALENTRKRAFSEGSDAFDSHTNTPLMSTLIALTREELCNSFSCSKDFELLATSSRFTAATLPKLVSEYGLEARFLENLARQKADSIAELLVQCSLVAANLDNDSIAGMWGLLTEEASQTEMA